MSEEPDWTDAAWLASVREWVDAQLAALAIGAAGDLEQTHVRRHSTVIRVPTSVGDAYFKANTPLLRHEAAVVALLAARRPDCVPPLLAADPDRGWLLLGDAGIQLTDLIGDERDLTRWLDVLPLYAGVQIAVADEADALIALGVPDLRLATLPAQFEQLLDELPGLPADERARLRAAVPEVVEWCAELAAYGVPETLQHDDLDDDQVFLRDGRYVILDWADACVSHPFFSLSVALEGVIAWGLDDVAGSVEIEPFRDAYLAPFAAGGAGVDLAAASSLALRLGWVCRAVNGHRVVSLDEASRSGETGPTRTRLRMFLDGSAE